MGERSIANEDDEMIRTPAAARNVFHNTSWGFVVTAASSGLLFVPRPVTMRQTDDIIKTKLLAESWPDESML